MRHSFDVVYELDCTVGEAVVAYLDAEHYTHLHRNHLPEYRTLDQTGFRIAIEQAWTKGPLRIGNRCMTEYVPPAMFVNDELRPLPFWLPSIHHLMKTRTELEYLPTPDGERTISRLRVTLDMPWFFWPFRSRIEALLVRLKIEKDQEDVEMIAEQQRLYGRGNLQRYLRKEVFLLHKEAFLKAFGLASEEPGRARE